MNLENGTMIHRTPQGISAVFIILAISLQVSLALYWFQVLQPKLLEEAAADAKILAESQASQLLDALENAQIEGDNLILESQLDQLLLYQEPVTGLPFFKQIRLELDSEHFPESAQISRGETQCTNCFKVEVALYSPETFEILGIAHFLVSDEFFKSLAQQIQKQLMTVGVISLLLLTMAWLTSMMLIRFLRKEISRRQASEAALSENQEKYHRLVSSLNQYFVYTRNPDGKISYSSEAVKILYGFEPEEMQDLANRLTDNPINKIARHYLQKPNAEEQQVEYELEITDRQGNSRWLSMAEVNLFDENNQLYSIEGLARDITKQKQIEADLLKAKEDAEIASKAKGQFLANMSHEIRTPMNAIIGNSYLMQKTPLNVKQQQYIKRVDSSAQVLLRLVNDVLDISKIEAGKMELEQIPFQLDEVLENLSNVVINLAQKKGLDIIYDIEPGIPQALIGDPLRLEQVLLNLVNNAIKFTEKGEILLRIRQQTSDGGHIVLHFAVKDDGIGIPESKQKSLFQSFNQVDSSMTRKFGGTGLGLAICQHLVSMMQGQIQVESVYGKGSTFSFTANFGQPDSEQQTSHGLSPQLLDQHVLVIDDSTASTTILHEMLAHLGLQVTEAHSGSHGLQLLKEKQHNHPVDIVLIDLKMPGLNGIETVQRMIASEELVEKPHFVLITAYGLSELESEEIEQLFDNIIHKPVTESMLVTCLNNTLSTQQKSIGKGSIEPAQLSYQDKNVLLVEDNIINQEVALALLQDVGINADMADDGQQALEKAKQKPYDLIFMDIQMPVMDGLTSAKTMRDSLAITCPIIAMTANALEQDKLASKEAGMNAFISKPIDVDTFYSTLAQWLEVQTSVGERNGQLLTVDELPVIPGLEVTSAIKRVGNKLDLFDNLLGSFANSYSRFADKLTASFEANDNDLLSRLLHQLKGESGNISATKLHQLSSAAENHIRHGNTLEQTHIEELCRSLNTVLDALNDYFSAAQPTQTGNENADVAQLDKAELANLVAKLETSLENQALDALDLGAQLENSINGQLDKELVEEFSTALNQLDFELASTALRQIALQLYVD